ncbi:MAG: PAS domain S-box protein [Syntrophobacteraceae bacterium]
MKPETATFGEVTDCRTGCDLHEQFRAVVDAFDGYIYICSQDNRIEFMNRKLIEHMGYDATGRPSGEIPYEEDSVCPRSVTEAVFRGETVKREVLSLKDNRWYYVANTPIYRADGRICKQAMLLDITDRKLAEEARRDSEEKYGTLVEGSADAILMIENDGKMISCNRAFLDLLGFERDEVVGKSVEIVHTSRESARLLWQTIKEAMEDPGSITTEWELVRKDGTRLLTEQTICQIKGEDGAWKGRVATIRDIGMRRKAEKELAAYRAHLEDMVRERTRELEQAQKSLVQREKLKTLGAISAEVAHEIRNPLTSIGGFANRLQKKFPDSKEAGIIVDESRRLEALLDRISSYLKPIPIRYEECCIGSIICETLNLLSRELDEQGIGREFEGRSDNCSVSLDPGIFAQVVVNVVRNGVALMDRGRPLVLRTFESGRDVHLHFRIPVQGLTITNPELLFFPFTESGRLMFALSSRLVDAMGGSFSYTQEQDWMIFMISMPKSQEDICASKTA